MDYEKAYKAALKTATQWIKDGCTDKEKICLECVFPELRESEDERIRRTLVEYFSPKVQLDLVRGVPIQKIRDWLEKQKEQNHDGKKWIYEDDYYKFLDRSFNDGKDEVLENPEKYGLQKEQKPAYWSEEDERILYNVIAYVGYAAGERGVKDGDFKEANEWLKSLRPQPKQEVTDEEIEEMVTKRSRSSGTTKSEMAFYRNGIKDAIKRFGLRPSWKPSEEQMKALNAMNCCGELSYQGQQQLLIDLYRQLKKL